MNREVDENGNFYLRFYNTFGFILWQSPEYRARVDSLQANIEPISQSFYEATSPSTDYVEKVIGIIKDLLNERRTESDDGDYEMVFVWDIADITTAALQHFVQSIVHHYETKMHILQDIIAGILKKAKFCNFYDMMNVVNIEDVDEAESEDMKERASSYYALEKFYNRMSARLREDGPIINYELIKKSGLIERILPMYNVAARMQRLFHQRWKTARKCLGMVNKKSSKYENVVLCQDGIGDGCAQLLLSGCSKYIKFENIYSFTGEHSVFKTKEMVLERIQKRFGEKCVLVYVTSEPQTISEKLQIPIWEIKANDSIEHLCNAIQNVL